MIPRFNSKGRLIGFRGVDRDVTERRRMEAEALKTHKLESLGVLAGGIAHDFNNILTAVMGNVSLARDGLPGNSAAAGRLVEAERALLRAQDLTHQLLTFAKGGAPVRRPTSIQAVVTESAGFVLSGSSVLPVIGMQDDLWPVEIDVGQFSQVVQNLVLNASQAMASGGTVAIHGRNVEEILDSTGELLSEPLRWVELTVADEGPGIPPDVADRVFEPYFSTKAKGSGLGLSVCHSVVKNHDGRIWFDSVPGQGTTFHIRLPASKRIPEAAVVPITKSRNGKGRVLVMDDEPMILDVAKGALEASGFSVDTVPSGTEAVRAFSEAMKSGKPFRVVVLDVTVAGGMGGLETLEQLQAMESGVRAVVSSGYATAPVLADHRGLGFRGMLTKPYRPSDLVEAVSRAAEDKGWLDR
jgi:nitrogen-specific signal transduction histidine kinase/CheY-like chemotaxis protein